MSEPDASLTRAGYEAGKLGRRNNFSSAPLILRDPERFYQDRCLQGPCSEDVRIAYRIVNPT
jgi:hypothetical protein